MPKTLTALQWNMGERQRKIDAITELSEKAQAEGRTPSDGDREYVDKAMSEISELDKVIANLQDSDKLNEMVERLGDVRGPAASVSGKAQYRPRSVGDFVVNSPMFKALMERKKGGGLGVFSGTDALEVPRSLIGKAAIADDDSLAVLSEGSDVAGNLVGGPGGDIIQPQLYSTTIQAPGFQRLTIADLMAQGQTNSNTVRYLKETSSVSGAASVHEGADKPASTFLFNDVNEPVVKIATFLPVSEEMLEDVAQIRSYLDARLTQFVQIEEEDQLMNGTGTADLDGLLNRTTQTVDASLHTNVFDAIAAARVKVQTVGFAEPDAIVINPNDAYDLDIAKASTAGNYYSGGPYSQAADTPWGMRMVRTTAIPAGHVLVGAFKTQAQIFRRGGLRVDASNSHEDYFRRNLVAIRVEERLALAVYRINAFCEILNAS